MPTLKFKDFPNIFKTITPLSIVRPKVTKAYFAEATIEEVEVEGESGEQESEIYTVVSGDTLGKIANKKGTTVSAIIESDETITTANQNSLNIGQEITLPSTVAAKEKKKKITFKKVDTGNLGQEIYVIVETELLQGKTMAINVRQGKEKGIEEQDENIMFKDDQDNYHTMVKTTIGGMCETDYLNKNDFADQAIFKIAIDSSDKEKKDGWIQSLNDATDKKTLLYILADAHTLEGQTELNIQYFGDTEEGEIRGEKITNRWLDTDGQWFEFKKGCDCGQKYDKQFKCVKSGSKYGPLYMGNQKLADYKHWDSLINEGRITKMEKDILVGMSENEGNLDSVQSYDSEILTVGAMQKTINPIGKGEFPIQVEEFKKSNPDKYKNLFEDCGWTADEKKMYYNDPNDSSSSKITGSALKTKIREGFVSSEYNKKIKCKPLEPIVRASKDKDFQAKQVGDFIDRLRNKVLPLKPTGYTYKLSDYLESKLGRALVLDHHVNRPGHVKKYFGEALNRFFKKKDDEVEERNKDKKEEEKESKISRKPSEWGEQHSSYEKAIIKIYGPLRGEKLAGVKHPMTHATKRYNNLKNKL
ncbi:LysM peptidoglycan-binding domain-containing protein [Aquimarina sp. M1]